MMFSRRKLIVATLLLLVLPASAIIVFSGSVLSSWALSPITLACLAIFLVFIYTLRCPTCETKLAWRHGQTSLITAILDNRCPQCGSTFGESNAGTAVEKDGRDLSVLRALLEGGSGLVAVVSPIGVSLLAEVDAWNTQLAMGFAIVMMWLFLIFCITISKVPGSKITWIAAGLPFGIILLAAVGLLMIWSVLKRLSRS